MILDVDAGTLETSYDDLSTLPADIISSLKKRLKEQQTDKVRTNYVIGDMVARAFLKALVALIGKKTILCYCDWQLGRGQLIKKLG